MRIGDVRVVGLTEYFGPTHAPEATYPEFDAALMAHPVLNFHPLVNTMTTSIARHDLIRFLAETGHPARVAPVSGEGAAA